MFYSVYTCSLVWNEGIREAYENENNGSDPAVSTQGKKLSRRSATSVERSRGM